MFNTGARMRGIASDGENARGLCSRATGIALCLCLLSTIYSVCATVSCGAQASSHPVPSPLLMELQRAIGMAERGDMKHALALANELLENHADFVPALKLKGMLLEESGNQAEASHVYERALQLAPKDTDLLFKLGTAQLAVGNQDQTINLLLRLLKIKPKNGDALFYLAQAYHLKGQDDQALKTIRECVRVEPGNAQAWQKLGELIRASGDSESGLQMLLKAQRLDPTLDKIDFDIGAAYYYKMDFANAVLFSARAAEKHPGDLSVLKLLASADVKLSQWQEARAVFERILALKKGDGDSLVELGHCELELKQYQEAVNTLQQALQVNPAQIQAHYYLSRAFTGIGATEEARHEAELHHMMDQMSFAPPALGSEGNMSVWDQARQLLTEHHEDDALHLLQTESRTSAIPLGDSYVLVGSIYLSMGNTKDGKRALNHAIEIAPKVRGAHTYIGLAALQQGDLDAAEKEFEAELANDRNYLPAIAELGEVRYRQQRWADAADLLLRSRTTTPVLLYMLCDSYFHLGKNQDARLTSEVAAAYARNEPEVLRALIDLLSRNGESALAQRLSGAEHQ